MGNLVSAFGLIANVLVLVATLFAAVRFLLQAMRTDAHNPIAQSVIRITNPVLSPLRAILPSVDRVDLASLAAVWLFQMADMALSGRRGLGVFLWGGLIETLALFTNLFFYALIVIVIMSFVAPTSGHPAAHLLRQLTDPVLAPVRRVIRPVGGLDFSVLAVLFGLMLFRGSILPWLGGFVGS